MVQIPLHLQEDEISVRGISVRGRFGALFWGNFPPTHRPELLEADFAEMDFNVQYHPVWNVTCTLPVNGTQELS